MRGTAFMCETGLIQERLRLHTFARDFVLNRVSTSWRWFHPSGAGSLMPSFEGVQEGCQRGANEIRGLIYNPIGSTDVMFFDFDFHAEY